MVPRTCPVKLFSVILKMMPMTIIKITPMMIMIHAWWFEEGIDSSALFFCFVFCCCFFRFMNLVAQG